MTRSITVRAMAGTVALAMAAVFALAPPAAGTGPPAPALAWQTVAVNQGLTE
jgi:hypothetical protein